MILPGKLLESLEHIEGFDEKAFKEVHEKGEQITSIRINPLKGTVINGKWELTESSHQATLHFQEKVPWSSFGYHLAERPSFTFDPLFHSGCYYVQEASSMFLEQALKQTVDLSQKIRVLDLCAAPGGKSTHIQSLISPDSLLVSNDVIKTRTNVLKQNILKWGSANVVVTNNDPKNFSRLEGFFDVLVIDAPCSGSGLFRRDMQAINEWSEDNVLLCCGRQKRIIADAFSSLREGGILIYSTCSFSKEEDEDIADWLANELGMRNEKLSIDDDWNIVETESEKTKSFGYRFFPYKLKGEGFFLACFRKTTTVRMLNYHEAKLEYATTREKNIVAPWIAGNDVQLLKTPFIHALPANFIDDYVVLKNALNIQYAGVNIGEVKGEKLIPDHALALNVLLADKVPAIELEYKDAIRYLQKADLNITPATQGWQLVRYQKHNLGWINALPNRINNYYPKELRILKQ